MIMRAFALLGVLVFVAGIGTAHAQELRFDQRGRQIYSRVLLGKDMKPLAVNSTIAIQEESGRILLVNSSGEHRLGDLITIVKIGKSDTDLYEPGFEVAFEFFDQGRQITDSVRYKADMNKMTSSEVTTMVQKMGEQPDQIEQMIQQIASNLTQEISQKGPRHNAIFGNPEAVKVMSQIIAKHVGTTLGDFPKTFQLLIQKYSDLDAEAKITMEQKQGALLS